MGYWNWAITGWFDWMNNRISLLKEDYVARYGVIGFIIVMSLFSLILAYSPIYLILAIPLGLLLIFILMTYGYYKQENLEEG